MLRALRDVGVAQSLSANHATGGLAPCCTAPSLPRVAAVVTSVARPEAKKRDRRAKARRRATAVAVAIAGASRRERTEGTAVRQDPRAEAFEPTRDSAGGKPRRGEP